MSQISVDKYSSGCSDCFGRHSSPGPYKTRISAHRHIGTYRGAWWLATLLRMAANDAGNMAE